MKVLYNAICLRKHIMEKGIAHQIFGKNHF